MHLDLRYSGLSALIIRMLVQAISQSSSLMSVHLCGNPGLSRELILEIQVTLGSKDPFKPENYIPSLKKEGDVELSSYAV